jgi:hypothetical protein
MKLVGGRKLLISKLCACNDMIPQVEGREFGEVASRLVLGTPRGNAKDIGKRGRALKCRMVMCSDEVG